jgi:hypothetical protein
MGRSLTCPARFVHYAAAMSMTRGGARIGGAV